MPSTRLVANGVKNNNKGNSIFSPKPIDDKKMFQGCFYNLFF
jgi:hypothetical protein